MFNYRAMSFHAITLKTYKAVYTAVASYCSESEISSGRGSNLNI